MFTARPCWASEGRLRWSEVVDTPVDTSEEKSESHPPVDENSYESQAPAASALGGRLGQAVQISGKRGKVAENVQHVKKAKKDSVSNDVNVALGTSDHKIKQRRADEADHTMTGGAGSSRDVPQDKIAQLRQMFEGVPDNVLKEHLDFNGGSVEKVIDSLEEQKAREEQAEQKRNAAQVSVEDKIAMLRRKGFKETDKILREKLAEKGGDLPAVMDALRQHRENKPWEKYGKKLWIITDTKRRHGLWQAHLGHHDEIDYPAFNARRPRAERNRWREPMTPDPRDEDMSKRAWETEVHHWKQMLKEWKRERTIIGTKQRQDDEIDYPAFNEKRPRAVRIPGREPMTPDPRANKPQDVWETEVRGWEDLLKKWKRENGGD